MHVHPAIAALRSDPASQRRTQAAMADTLRTWREASWQREIAADLARYAAGAVLTDCAAVSALLGDRGAACAFVAGWSAPLIEALNRYPLAEVPFGYRHTKGYSTVQLLSAGGATLGVSAYERQPGGAEPRTALFVDRESSELVLAGTARGASHRLVDDGTVETSTETWRSGDRIAMHYRRARQIVAVEGALLVLQLSRTPRTPRPTRQYRLADSCLLKVASGDRQASRDLMALAVIGAMEHPAGLAAMQQVCADGARDPDVRWEAVRQALALDPAGGFALLSGLAGCPTDPLFNPALRLRAQLAEAHPHLAEAA
ncbi:hypothetical protein [Erythrobacter sp. JK5]|uniref:hypothetical protein n=1 Tax=Erythrobacter sp. JK5 TaxID=2829500 RepID=UPI001BAD5D25|nr:hypothetical protein [Erythrobacter sp. JK5]QUL39230.1 hypothetical protein KDC96_07945 [Erythrobacter sp. JK5]